MPEPFYNPMMPGWLAWVLATSLFGLGCWKLVGRDRRFFLELAYALGLWACAGLMVYVAVALGLANDTFAAHSYGYPPPLLLDVLCWVVPGLAFVAFAWFLDQHRLTDAAIAFLVASGSFTVAAFVMLLVTYANDWALATTFAWIVTGLAVLGVVAAAAYEQRQGPGGVSVLKRGRRLRSAA